MNKELDRGAEFMSSRDHIAGKAIAVKGESAEETDFPKSVSGTVQNMYRTVTYVERYRGRQAVYPPQGDDRFAGLQYSCSRKCFTKHLRLCFLSASGVR